MKKIFMMISIFATVFTLAACTDPKEVIEEIKCSDTQTLVDGACIDDEVTCEPGNHLEGDICIADELICDDGFHVAGIECIKDELICDDGYEVIDDTCINEMIAIVKSRLFQTGTTFTDVTADADLSGYGVEKVELINNGVTDAGYLYTVSFDGDIDLVRVMIAIDNDGTILDFEVIDSKEVLRYGGRLNEETFKDSFIGQTYDEVLDERFDLLSGATITMDGFKSVVLPLVAYYKSDVLGIIDVDEVFCTVGDDNCIEAIEILIDDMTLMEKVAQMLQAERGNISPAQVREYGIGSILSGGGSHPTSWDDDADTWYNMYASYQDKALESGSGIPLIYGIDAVHGNNNLYGATIFPHNIGLGMANDADLMFRIGAATAKEVKVTGISWNFAPALSVVQDISWGRSYEGFSENPEIHTNLTYATIMGMQQFGVSATAKHFFGDGGTNGGTDRGNTIGDEAYLRAVHLVPYYEAIRADVDTIMISYSSINGEKMHGFDYWIQDVLKDEMGFEGFIISDWSAIAELNGSLEDQVVNSVNAGVDMLMEPYNWENVIHTLYGAVINGRITEDRVDDAVRRILTIKHKRGLLDDPYGRLSVEDNLYTQEHQDLAREAARKSLVLLKNENDVLPLNKNEKIYFAGPASYNVGLLLGGWSRYWQGTQDADFGYGTSIEDAFGTVLTANGGSIVGNYNDADVVVVVLAEVPYAEGNGDTNSIYLDSGLAHPENAAALAIAAQAKAAGKQVVGILISGRPLVLGTHIDNFDGFIAAWLPGTEGGLGIADVVFGDYDFTGTLSFTWPVSVLQLGENSTDEDYDPNDYMYPYGYGLEYTN